MIKWDTVDPAQLDGFSRGQKITTTWCAGLWMLLSSKTILPVGPPQLCYQYVHHSSSSRCSYTRAFGDYGPKVKDLQTWLIFKILESGSKKTQTLLHQLEAGQQSSSIALGMAMWISPVFTSADSNPKKQQDCCSIIVTGVLDPRCMPAVC